MVGWVPSYSAQSARRSLAYTHSVLRAKDSFFLMRFAAQDGPTGICPTLPGNFAGSLDSCVNRIGGSSGRIDRGICRLGPLPGDR